MMNQVGIEKSATRTKSFTHFGCYQEQVESQTWPTKIVTTTNKE